MIGYTVYFEQSVGKNKKYVTTEFYNTKTQAQERTLKLNIASNITFISIAEIEYKYINIETIKN